MNEQNLIPFTSDQSREQAAINGRKGGIASGIAKRKRKNAREEAQYYSQCIISAANPRCAEVKKMLRANGATEFAEEPTQLRLLIARMFQSNKPEMTKLLLQLLGELKEDTGVTVNAPPIVIGIHDPGFIEAERRRQDQMLKDMGVGDVVEVEAEDEPTDAEPTPLPTSDEAEENEAQPPTPEIVPDEQESCTSEVIETQQPPANPPANPPAHPQTAEKPPVDAPKPQDGGRSPDASQANVAQPGASVPQPAKKPMTRAEAVAAMEAERRAKGGNSEAVHTPVKPMFLPSGFGRRR